MSPRKPPAAVLRLNLDSSLPVYLQLVDQVQRQASAGRLRPGERLPTVRGLGASLGVNFNTVARAYRLLHEAGVVSAQRGRGTFIRGGSLSGSNRRVALRTLASLYIAQAQRQDFPQSEILGMVSNLLGTRGRSARPNGGE